MSKIGLALLPPSITNEQAIRLLRAVSKANFAIGEMKASFKHTALSSSLLSVFFLNESVQSTRIEGTQVTFSDMLDMELNQKAKWEQQEVLNYMNALNLGIEKIQNGAPITTRLIKELHSVLMKNARGTNSAGGEYRRIQNFIGPDNDIKHAVYIPVIAADVDKYMENLEFFINGEAHQSIAKGIKKDFVIDENCEEILKIAIMHAQFESIHPFLDGNGRMGRILIAILAVKLGLVDKPIFLVSEELEKERARYYDLLNGVRGASPDWYSWLYFFVIASERMAKKLMKKLRKAEMLREAGEKKCLLSSEKRVWLYSFKNPVFTTSQVANGASLSLGTARKCSNKLSEKGLFYADENKKRNKKYRNYEIIRILSE